MLSLKTVRKRVNNERGQAVTELALVVPILMMLIIGGILLGLVVYNQIVIVTSANQGARLGAALMADENVSNYTAQARAESLAGDTLSHVAGGCNTINAGRSGDSFVVEINCPYGLPIPFMEHRTVNLGHKASYYIFE
ncbi:hypothetical protein GN156_06840 [bacterium LRH843]|nr:hypothetical protein [bacterium LRH843]